MRREGYNTWSMCLSVCLCVRLLPRFLPLYATRWPRSDINWFYTGFIKKMAIFIKILHSKVMPWKPSEQANNYANEFELTGTAFVHFRDQRSTATTGWTTGEPSVSSEAGYRGRRPVRGEKIDRRWTVSRAPRGDRYAHAQLARAEWYIGEHRLYYKTWGQWMFQRLIAEDCM